MLLVNGFRPTQKSYNNPHPSKNNFGQSQFLPKSDSVNFSARICVVKTTADEVRQLVAEFIPPKPYIGIFGEGAKMHLGNAKAFLESNGILIRHDSVPFFETAIAWNNSQGIVINAAKATLVDKAGNPISSTSNMPLTVTDITPNAANLKIFNYLSSGLWGVKDASRNVTIPENLNAVLIRMSDDLGEFRNKWLEIDYDDADQKAASLKWAYHQLMPPK